MAPSLKHYSNTIRHHSALGYKPPALEANRHHRVYLSCTPSGLQTDRRFRQAARCLNKRLALPVGADQGQVVYRGSRIVLFECRTHHTPCLFKASVNVLTSSGAFDATIPYSIRITENAPFPRVLRSKGLRA